ncbi:MAG: hypothetical protein LBL01_02580, partial [Bifidobacteriaceae bacterium]|nr:hypothetical protein [Bifidobacteriaceae bacterium]
MSITEFDLDTADAAVLDEHTACDQLGEIARARPDLQVTVAWHPGIDQELLEWLRDTGSPQAARVARVRLAARSIRVGPKASEGVADQATDPAGAASETTVKTLPGAAAALPEAAAKALADAVAASAAAPPEAAVPAEPAPPARRTQGYVSRAERFAAIRAQTPAEPERPAAPAAGQAAAAPERQPGAPAGGSSPAEAGLSVAADGPGGTGGATTPGSPGTAGSPSRTDSAG